jgi:hypothetical protein
MTKQRRRVVTSPEEAQMAQQAEALKTAGFKSFESVYGSKKQGSFDLDADMAEQQKIFDVSNNHQQGVDPQPFIPPSGANGQYLPAPSPDEPIDEDEEQDTVKANDGGLSDDPFVRAEQIAKALKEIRSDAPSANTLREWRNVYGGIFMLNIEDLVFVFRYLNRQEWIQLNAEANMRKVPLDDVQLDEKFFARCVLWPRFDAIQLAALPANTQGMVAAQIRIRSMFLDPGFVSQMTFKI